MSISDMTHTQIKETTEKGCTHYTEIAGDTYLVSIKDSVPSVKFIYYKNGELLCLLDEHKSLLQELIMDKLVLLLDQCMKIGYETEPDSFRPIGALYN